LKDNIKGFEKMEQIHIIPKIAQKYFSFVTNERRKVSKTSENRCCKSNIHVSNTTHGKDFILSKFEL